MAGFAGISTNNSDKLAALMKHRTELLSVEDLEKNFKTFAKNQSISIEQISNGHDTVNVFCLSLRKVLATINKNDFSEINIITV